MMAVMVFIIPGYVAFTSGGSKLLFDVFVLMFLLDV